MNRPGSRPVTDLAALEALYGEPAAASLAKEVPALTPGYRALIEASPFLILATSGPGGLDASPRGDGPGFVRVAEASAGREGGDAYDRSLAERIPKSLY